MLHDGLEIAPGTELDAEVCIVGTGAAGTIVALELARSGHDVILLEAGGRRVETSVQDSLRGSEGTGEHDPLESVRQKRLGGTTMQWGGRCTPLDEIDFEKRPAVPHSGWPISRTDLLPHYRRASDYLETGEFEFVAHRAIGDPLPLFGTSVGSSAVLDDDRIWRFGPPVRFGRRYGRELARSHRIRLVTHANVLEIEQDPASGLAVRARCAAAPGREFTVRARRFVVAAGGLETARLLLASNTVQADGLGSSGGWLGRGYMTHPVAEIGRLQLTDPRKGEFGDFRFSHDGVYVRRQLQLRPDVQRREGLRNLGLALFYPDPMDPGHGDGLLSAFALARKALTQSGLDWKATGTQRRFGATSDVPQHLANIGNDLPRVARFGATWIRRRYLARRQLPSFMTRSKVGLHRLRFDAEQSPDPANRVELTGERDAYGAPRLAVHFSVSQDDRASIADSLEIVARELQETGVGTLELPPRSRLLDEQVFADGTHQMGLTRMSDDPSHGVVDRNCAVHDVPNVFVAGSAVFPTAGMCGPTMTIAALALRLADHLDRTLPAT